MVTLNLGFSAGNAARIAVAGVAMAAALAAPSAQAQYREKITNNPANCDGSEPAVRVSVAGIKSSQGTVRAQVYRATKADWLETGRWLHRIEQPAKAGTMTFCLPVPAAGNYAVAVRHDVNNNGKTDLTQDGGGASNNPSYSVFNLGKPSYTKTGFSVGDGVKSITINMRYM